VGVGKTALLEYAVGRASDLAVLRGTAAQAEAHLPFAFLHQLLRPALGSLGALPDLQSHALGGALGLAAFPEPDRFLIAVAVLSLLAEHAEPQPVLCVVDDAQWLDPESLDTLAFVARRASTERMAFVFATTDAGTEPSGLPSLTVPALDRVASDELVVEHAGLTPPPDVRAYLWKHTRGNPLALIETVSAMSEAELAGRQPIDDAHLPGTALHQALAARLETLPDDARTLLLVTAAEGTGDIGLVLRASELLGIGASALAPAESADLVAVDGDAITFRHPLMGAVVYHGAPFGQRQAVHRALADSLAAERDADRRVWHRSAAAVAPADGIAAELEQAAVRARVRGGHAAAADALARASDLTSEPSLASRRMVLAAESSWAAGRASQARAYSRRAAALDPSSDVRIAVEHLRGLVEGSTGDRRVALATLLGAASIDSDDRARTARILLDAAQLAWSDADIAALVEVAERLAKLDLPAEAPESFAATLITALGQLARGDVPAGASLLRAAITPDDQDDPRQLHLAGTACIFAGDDRSAFELLQRAAARARELGAVTSLPATLTNLAALEVWRADFPAARAFAAEGADLAGAVGQAQWVAQCTALLAWMAAVQGRHEESGQLASEAIDLATRHHARSPIALARWVQAMSAIGSSRWPDAMTALEAVADERAVDFHPPTAFLSAGDLIETACRVGRLDVALATLAKFEEFARPTTAAWASALGARCRALVSHGDAAAHCFEEALAHHAESGRHFDTARTHLLYGEHLRRAGQRSSARIHLRKALDSFERLGASPWEERARRELRATGETARKREPSAFTELTPQQVQIINLVADGATNKDIAGRLFLSPRTVDYHLRNVFVKLGITSRAELIRLNRSSPEPSYEGPSGR